MTPPPPDRPTAGADPGPADPAATAGRRGGRVMVERRDLRRMRSLLTGLLAGVLALVAILVVVLGQNQRRCEDGNQFRRQDLPAAFDHFAQFLGEEFRADPERVADGRARFAVVMDELFPERECPFLPSLPG